MARRAQPATVWENADMTAAIEEIETPVEDEVQVVLESVPAEPKVRKPRRKLTDEEKAERARFDEENARLIADPVLVASPPAAAQRIAGPNRYDSFRETLAANPNHWAVMVVCATKVQAQTKAHMVRNGTGRWASHVWDAVVTERDNANGEAFEVWVTCKGPKAQNEE